MKANRFLIIGLMVVLSCDGSDSGGGGDTAAPAGDYSQVLGSAAKVMQTQITSFATKLTSLQEAVTTHCRNPTTESQTHLAARTAWQETMAAWQRLAAYQAGPIAKGGVNEMIYSAADPCGVDRQIVATTVSFPEGTLQRVGLGALEYLLFSPVAADSLCTTATTAYGSWAALSVAERHAARCQYMNLLTARLQKHSTTLTGNGGASWFAQGNTSDLAQELHNSLYYLEFWVKDDKLGTPIGILGSSKTAAEHPFAKTSLESIEQNIIGFHEMMVGDINGIDGEGQGFFDFLDDGNVKTNIAAGISESLSILGSKGTANLTEDSSYLRGLAGGCETEPDNYLCRLYAAVKKITDELKGDYADAIGFEVPDGARSDGD